MAIDELAPGSSHERQARAAAWAAAGSGGRGGARPQGERMTILGIDPGKLTAPSPSWTKAASSSRCTTRHRP